MTNQKNKNKKTLWNYIVDFFVNVLFGGKKKQ
ncbi:MAG: hypothetical protein ACI9NI_002061 [Olleya marilimosa]|jgi:hypothetical protein